MKPEHLALLSLILITRLAVEVICLVGTVIICQSIFIWKSLRENEPVQQLGGPLMLIVLSLSSYVGFFAADGFGNANFQLLKDIGISRDLYQMMGVFSLVAVVFGAALGLWLSHHFTLAIQKLQQKSAAHSG